MVPTAVQIDTAEKHAQWEARDREQKAERVLEDAPGGYWDTMFDTYHDYHN